MDARSISLLLEARRHTIAENATARQYAEHPDLLERHGPAGRERALEDSHFNLRHLSQAIALGNPSIFADYTAWLKVLLMRRRVRLEVILDHYRYLGDEIRAQLDPEPASVACNYIAKAARLLPEMPEDLPSFIEGDAPVSLLSHLYLQSLLRGDRRTAAHLVLAAADDGMPVEKNFTSASSSSPNGKSGGFGRPTGSPSRRNTTAPPPPSSSCPCSIRAAISRISSGCARGKTVHPAAPTPCKRTCR